MAGNKLAIALLVLFIAIIGVPIGVLGFRCATGVNRYDMEMFEKSRQKHIQRYGSDEGFTYLDDPRDNPNVDPVSCRVPFWQQFIRYPYGYHKRTEVRNAAVGILGGTVILDGMIIGAYMVFGKGKRHQRQDTVDEEAET